MVVMPCGSESKLKSEPEQPKVAIDSFYSESNINHLNRGIEALNAGKGMEHEIIEED